MNRRLAAIFCVLLFGSPAHTLAGFYDEGGKGVIRIHATGTLKQPKDGTVDFDEYATGFIVSPNGFVLTAGHVIPAQSLFSDGPFVEAWLPKAYGDSIEAADETAAGNNAPPLDVVKFATSPQDVALLKIDTHETGALKYFRLCSNYSVGDSIVVLGYSGGAEYLSQSFGSISAPASGERPLLIQAPLNPGDSGDPVLNSTGEVVAINIGAPIVGNVQIQGRSFATTVPLAMRDMSPDIKSLIGISYEPNCQKPLSGKGIIQVAKKIRIPGKSGNPSSHNVLDSLYADGYQIDRIVGSEFLESGNPNAHFTKKLSLKKDGDQTYVQMDINSDVITSRKDGWPTIGVTLEATADKTLLIDTSIPAKSIVQTFGLDFSSKKVDRTVAEFAATQAVKIPDGYSVSKVLDAVAVGYASGRVEVSADRSDAGINVKISGKTAALSDVDHIPVLVHAVLRSMSQ